MAPGAPSPRILPLLPARLVALAVAALVLVTACSGDDDEAATTTTTTASTTTSTAPAPTTTTTPDPVAVDALLAGPLLVDAPSSYRITYDVVENGLPRVEEWTVRRPYESLVLSTREGVVLTGTATSRARLQTFLSDRGGWLPIQPELHRAAYDLHPAPVMAAMEALGLAERQGEAEHLGRRCTVYRTGQPTSATVTAPSDGEQTDVCIDDAGLVLHERWQIGGSTVVERTVTALDLDPEVDDATFDPGPEAEGAEALARAFTTIAVPADEETMDRLSTEVPLPEGYVDDGAVFRAAGGTGPGGTTPGAAEIVRFYSSGPALLEVAEVYVDREAELGTAPAVPVAVEGWDEVWFEPGFRSSALRARLTPSSYVELRHHDLAFLFEVLGSLVRDGA